MKIARISIKNFLGLKEAEIEAGGRSQLITGGNAQGKTSILSAIKTAFVGSSDPGVVHVGAEGAELLVELDEISIDRKISNEGKQILNVRTSDGVKVSKPQKYLDEIANALAFNPVAFFFLKAAEKRDALLRAMPMRVTPEEVSTALEAAAVDAIEPEDAEGNEQAHDVVSEIPKFLRSPDVKRIDWSGHALDVIGKLYDAAYNTRHAIGQELKTKTEILKTATESLGPAEYDAEAHAEALRQLNAAQEWKRDISLAVADAVSLEEQIGRLKSNIESLQRGLEEAQQKLAKVQADRAELMARPERNIKFDELRANVAKLQDAKAVAAARQQQEQKLDTVRKEAQALAVRRDVYDVACTVLGKALPAQKLEEAGAPVPGLVITSDGVLVDGKPIDHLSGAEQMRVALAVAEASIPADGARILCIDGAERLDSEQFGILEERLGAGDLQGFVTRVTGGARVVESIEADEDAR